MRLIETLVAAAIAAVVLTIGVAMAARLTTWTTTLDTRVQSTGAAERLMERLSTEAASAWAVYVPAADVRGASNADGHEIAFFTEDASHRPYAWAYDYDAATKTIIRYSFVPGSTAFAGETLGPFDTFAASTLDVSQIAAADPLFAGAIATPVHYAFSASSAIGGNALIRLKLSATGVARDELLASATAPTTFTIIVPYTPSPPPVATPTPTPLTMTPMSS